MKFDTSTVDRGVSPVIAVVLLVAITAILAGVVGVFGLGFSSEVTSQPSATSASASIDETAAGTEVTLEQANSPVEVRLNGQTVYQLDQSDVGQSFYVPTAPGDTVRVVSTGDDSQLILSENVDQFESGDFIAYYSFDSDPATGTLEDQSGNGNTGTVGGDPQLVTTEAGTGWHFDGGNDSTNTIGDYVESDELEVSKEDDIEEFTVVVKYETTASASDGYNDRNGDRVQQLIEHHDEDSNFEWYLETTNNENSPYKVSYSIRPDGQVLTPELQEDDVHVLVATFDGEEMRYYLDGTLIGTDDIERTVSMGELSIAADGRQEDFQYLTGNLYEIRLYYTSFDDQQAKTTTEVVSSAD